MCVTTKENILCWVVGDVRPNHQGAVSRVCDPDK